MLKYDTESDGILSTPDSSIALTTLAHKEKSDKIMSSLSSQTVNNTLQRPPNNDNLGDTTTEIWGVEL